MNLKSISNTVTSKLGRQSLVLKQKSPTLMFGAGVVGVVGTVILASRATLKLEEVLDDTQSNIGLAKSLRERTDVSDEKYSERDYQRDMTYIYIKAGLRITKLYGPAFALGLVSIGALTTSHITLTRRNAGLVAAYAAVDKAFGEYRERVLADVGEEKEREYYHGTESREVYSQKKNGEPKVEEIKTSAGRSPYARIFEESNSNWSPTPEYNLIFLKAQQNYLNHQLQSRGHVMLNDAYDALGMDRTPAGAVTGWVKGHGDDYVDFGIWDDMSMARVHDFVTGREGAIVLDFNVDGVVYDKI